MSISEIRLANEARGLREQLGLNQEIPIGDLEQLVKEAGHQIASESFGNQFSAALMHLGGDRFLIVLNDDQMWNERFKRFTIAHELGHITLIEHLAVMHRNGGKLQTVAEFRSDIQIEREADIFAAHFLAPTVLFIKLTEYSEFNKESLKDVAEELNISLMSAAFRFVNLTDLACSLVISDNSSKKVRFEFRSKAFMEIGYLPFLRNARVPPDTLSYEVINGNENDPHDEEIFLNEWYPDLRADMKCNTSVFQLGYNDTTVTMLSITDDPEEFIRV